MAGLERMTTGSAVSALPYLATQVNLPTKCSEVINSGDNIAYEGMRQDTSCTKCDNWTMKLKTILNKYGFGSAWLNQSVEDQNKFIVLFERRINDNYIPYCFADIEASTRCHTYKDIKSIHHIEPYLQRDIYSILRFALKKLL